MERSINTTRRGYSTRDESSFPEILKNTVNLPGRSRSRLYRFGRLRVVVAGSVSSARVKSSSRICKRRLSTRRGMVGLKCRGKRLEFLKWTAACHHRLCGSLRLGVDRRVESSGELHSHLAVRGGREKWAVPAGWPKKLGGRWVVDGLRAVDGSSVVFKRAQAMNIATYDRWLSECKSAARTT